MWTNDPVFLPQPTRRYHFDLICPRCERLSEATQDRHSPPPHVNCGDCLMEYVEIVEMKVLKWRVT